MSTPPGTPVPSDPSVPRPAVPGPPSPVPRPPGTPTHRPPLPGPPTPARRPTAPRSPARSVDSAPGGQRFGRVTHRQPSGSGPEGRFGTYFVQDDETGAAFSFSYPDIVTEGFRTIRVGERVRFLTDPADPSHAVYVIRLDIPDVDAYYQ